MSCVSVMYPSYSSVVPLSSTQFIVGRFGMLQAVNIFNISRTCDPFEQYQRYALDDQSNTVDEAERTVLTVSLLELSYSSL